MMRIALSMMLLGAAAAGAAAQTWSDLGGSASGDGLSESGYASGSVTKLDAGGKPVVAWFSSDPETGTPSIRLKRWTGTAWVGLGGSDSGSGLSGSAWPYETAPAMALDSAGFPVVAWTDSGILLRRWNGTAWIEIGGSGSNGGITGSAGGYYSTSPSVAIDVHDRPVVAWTVSGHAYVIRWNGTMWIELGGSATGNGISGTGYAHTQAMVLDGSGNPVVAWSDDYTRICLRRWTGTAWAELGGSASGEALGTSLNGVVSPDLVLDADGRPTVTWSQRLPDSEYDRMILLRRWDGNAWTEFAGSYSGTGVSGISTFANAPSVALSPAGFPVVAWQDVSLAGCAVIRLRWWTGSEWNDIAGSGADGGISETVAADCYQPSLSVLPSKALALSWHAIGPKEVYLKTAAGWYYAPGEDPKDPEVKVDPVADSGGDGGGGGCLGAAPAFAGLLLAPLALLALAAGRRI